MQHTLLVLAFAAVVTACAANTQCTIGSVACDDGAVRRCAGPAEGGDADGELVVLVDDCAARSLTCQLGTGRLDATIGVCATTTCIEAHRSTLCPAVGEMRCAFGTTLQSCAMGTDGCLVWTDDTECADTGMTCTETATSAACS